VVITSEPDMIDSVNVLAKFANSDHNMLEWDIHPSLVCSLFSRPSLDYAKGHFTAIRQALKDTHWSHVLQGNANEQWQAFHGLEFKYIPVRRSFKRQKKAPWLTYKAVRLMRQKHKLYRKYKDDRHPAAAYRSAQLENP